MTATTCAVVVASVVAMRVAWLRARRPDVLGRLDGHVVRRPTDVWRHPPRVFVARAASVELPVALEELWRWWRIVLVVAAGLGWLVAGPVLAVLAALAVTGVPFVALSLLRSRATAAYDNNLVLALDAIARGVRSGGSLNQSIAEAASSVRGQVESDVRQVGVDVDRGRTLSAALEQWAVRRPRASVALAVGALALAAETGGPPARVIEEIGDALRQRLQVEAEARAMGAQARLSAVVVGLAPIGFALLASATDPKNAHVLFGTPLGLCCVVVGLGLDVVGAVWMQRISDSVVT